MKQEALQGFIQWVDLCVRTRNSEEGTITLS